MSHHTSFCLSFGLLSPLHVYFFIFYFFLHLCFSMKALCANSHASVCVAALWVPAASHPSSGRRRKCWRKTDVTGGNICISCLRTGHKWWWLWRHGIPAGDNGTRWCWGHSGTGRGQNVKCSHLVTLLELVHAHTWWQFIHALTHQQNLALQSYYTQGRAPA